MAYATLRTTTATTGISNSAANAAGAPVTTPAATKAGDLLVAVVAIDNQSVANLPAPSGWTAVPGSTVNDNTTTSLMHARAFWRLAPADGAQTFTFANGNSSIDMVAAILPPAAAGTFDPADPISGVAASTSAAATGTTVTPPNVTTGTPESWVFGLALARSSASGAPTFDWGATWNSAEQCDVTSRGYVALSGIRSSAANAATYSQPPATVSRASSYGGITLAVRRAPASTDAVQWKLDFTQANVVAGGCNDDSYQRQNAAGTFNDPTVPWPAVIEAAPGGRGGRAAPFAIPANYRRYEMVPAIPDLVAGQTRFFGDAFYLEPGFPPGSNYQVLQQIRQTSAQGSPPVAFEVLNGNLVVSGGWGIDATTPTRLAYMVTLLSGLQAGRWYNLVHRISTFSAAENTSVLDVWVDGAQVLSGYVLKPPTLVDGGSYWKLGIYHDPALAAIKVWHAGTAMGNTYAYVDPTQLSFSALTDPFDGTGPADEWTDNGAALSGGGLAVNVAQNAGNAVYSSRRSRARYTWPGSAVILGGVVMPGVAGDSANAQLWIRDPAPAGQVDRIGVEYVAAANRIDLIGQTGSYAPIGQTESLTYDPVAHYWLKLEHTGTAIVWSTSPDGLTWTVQRTLASPPAWTTKTTLQFSGEGFRFSGTNDTLRIGSIGVVPAALPTTPPVGADALQARTLREVRAWKAWLDNAGARGWVGEFGWVTLWTRYNDPAQGAKWRALGDTYLTDLDVLGLSGTVWAAGREWGQGYPLGHVVGTTVGDPLTIAHADSAPVVAAHPTRGAGTATRWRGVNLAGHETGIAITGGGTVRSAAPLVHTAADFAFLAAQGIDTIRLPLAWERLQPTLGAALDTAALAVLDGMLTAARQAGIRVVADLHNYARYTQPDGQVLALGGGLSSAQLSDFWTRLSTWVRSNATRSGVVVAYGLMNEPHALPGGVDSWTTASQAAVTAIRQGGDNRLLLVGGYQFSSLTSWTDNHPTGWITDPAGAFAYEAHHYWDTQSALGSRSGTYQQAKAGGGTEIETYATELAAATATPASAAGVTGTRSTAAARLTSSAAAAGVTATPSSTAPVGYYGAAATGGVTATPTVGWVARTTFAEARSVTATRTTLAPAVLGQATGVTATPTRADPFKGTTAAAVGVTGTTALAADVSTLPAVGGAGATGTPSTAAARLDAAAAAGGVTGSRTDVAAVRQSASSAVGITATTSSGAVLRADAAAAAGVTATPSTATPRLDARLAASGVTATPTSAVPLGVTATVTGTPSAGSPTQLLVARAVGVTGTSGAFSPTGITTRGAVTAVTATLAVAAAVVVRGAAARPGVTATRSSTNAGVVVVGAAVGVTATSSSSEALRVQLIAAAGVTATPTLAGAAEAFRPVFTAPPGPMVERTPVLRPRVLVVDSRTGKVHFELPFKTRAWSSKINDIGDGSVTVPVEDALEALYEQDAHKPGRVLHAIASGGWRYSLAMAYGAAATWGGPIKPARSVNLSAPELQISAMEFPTFFERRVLISPSGTGTLADASRDVVFRETNPRRHAYSVVAHAIAGVGRGLPVTCTAPPREGGNNVYRYRSYDLAMAWKALGAIAAGEDGPDIRFDPALTVTSDGEFLTYDLKIGDPYLDFGAEWVWDDITCEITLNSDVVGMATTLFVPGDGQDREKVIGTASENRLVDIGFPVLEEAVAGQADLELDQLTASARAQVAAAGTPTETWTLDTPTNGSPRPGQFRVGDMGRLDISRSWLIDPGSYRQRIVGLSGDATDSIAVTIEAPQGQEVGV